jgi:endonuclease/exonuclease/phosphatase family metal-dependent hydrolase
MQFSLRAFCYATLLLLAISAMWAGPGNSTITVMTQNMDAGTDLGFALAYINSTTPTVGIDLTYQEILQSGFAGRAAILAQEIATSKPDLVSLQEVTVWSTGPDATHQTPFVDQLSLLEGALAAVGADYTEVAVLRLTTLALPMSNGMYLGFMDRDVVLARTGFGTFNVRANQFTNILTIPTNLGNLSAPDGWIAADATLGGRTCTLVSTHLVSTIPGHPEVDLLQTAQAEELATIFGNSACVIVAGDFNSNATHTPPERTQSVAVMLGAGFLDTWPAVNHGNPGYTWPLYVEDPPAAHPNGPFERIDFIFERGLSIQAVDRLGWKAPHASDHAGVVAVLTF